MKKRFVITLLAVTLLAAPLQAILGVGDVVFDPTSYANAILMMGQLVKSVEQLQAQFTLQSFLATVVPVNMSARYQTASAPWQNLHLPIDRFGNLGAWSQQVNQGGDAGTAYQNASVPLGSYGGGFSQLAPDQQRQASSHYASVELADASNIDAMETIGQMRANARMTDRALAGLENDSLSSDQSMNSQVAILNKINAASVANIRTTRDTNRLLLSSLEQQLADSKSKRDSEASEINSQIERLERGAATKAQYTSTVTETLRGFRWR